MLARSRLPEKQKAIYAGRQHCYSAINTEKSIETKHENGETNLKMVKYHPSHHPPIQTQK